MQSPAIRVRDATNDDIDALTGLAAQVQTLHAQGRPDLFRPADAGALRDVWIPNERDFDRRHSPRECAELLYEPDPPLSTDARSA